MEFWEWFAVVMGGGALTIGTVVAFRVNVSFDVNDWLKDRRKQKTLRIQNVCPHVKFVEKADGEPAVQSLLVSPAMSPSWVCSQCGAVDNPGVWDPKAIAEHWYYNPKEYTRRMKEFDRLTALKPHRWWTPWR